MAHSGDRVGLARLLRMPLVRWGCGIGLGCYRSLVLVGLTVVIPAAGVAVGIAGTRFAFSWSAKLTAPLVVRVLASAGEAAMGAVWTAVAVWLMLQLTSKPLSQAARLVARRWLGLRLGVSYRQPQPVTRLATGYWWNGSDYHRSEFEARWTTCGFPGRGNFQSATANCLLSSGHPHGPGPRGGARIEASTVPQRRAAHTGSADSTPPEPRFLSKWPTEGKRYAMRSDMSSAGPSAGGRELAVSMDFRLLGPVETWCRGSMVPVPLGRQTAVLAALLLRANRVVSMPELIEALWASEPPRSARASVENYVKRLRDALGEQGRHRIVTRPPGYLIRVDADELDISRFEVQLSAARDAARAGLWAKSAGHSRAALALWRGEPLANVGPAALTTREAPRLTEVCLAAAELNFGAAIHLGHYGEAIGALRQLTSAYPFRERFYALLMTALYRHGRQAEALAVYQQARSLLVTDVGCEPGPELRELQQQILANNPHLPGNPPRARPAAGRRAVVCRCQKWVLGRASADPRSSRFCR